MNAEIQTVNDRKYIVNRIFS